MSMTEELALESELRKNDDLHAQERSDYASRFWPGHWKFVGLGSKDTRKHVKKPNGDWDQEASRILHTSRKKKGEWIASISTRAECLSAQFASWTARSTWMTCNSETSCSNKREKHKKGTASGNPTERPWRETPRTVEKMLNANRRFPNLPERRSSEKQSPITIGQFMTTQPSWHDLGEEVMPCGVFASSQKHKDTQQLHVFFFIKHWDWAYPVSSCVRVWKCVWPWHFNSQPKTQQTLSADHRLLGQLAFLQAIRFHRYFKRNTKKIYWLLPPVHRVVLLTLGGVPRETSCQLKSKNLAADTLRSTSWQGYWIVQKDIQNPHQKMSRWRRCMFLGKIQDPHHRRNPKHERRFSLQVVGTIHNFHGRKDTWDAGTLTRWRKPHAIFWKSLSESESDDFFCQSQDIQEVEFNRPFSRSRSRLSERAVPQRSHEVRESHQRRRACTRWLQTKTKVGTTSWQNPKQEVLHTFFKSHHDAI